jgi:hypothetical protein
MSEFPPVTCLISGRGLHIAWALYGYCMCIVEVLYGASIRVWSQVGKIPTLGTVLQVRLVLATAEPRGAYHLTPFDPVVRTSEHEWLHLVPYPESLQGCSAVSAVSDVSVLESAALASAVVCYPRTASAPVAALGVPVISLVTGPEATSGLPASLINLGTRVNTWQEAAAALNDASPMPG